MLNDAESELYQKLFTKNFFQSFQRRTDQSVTHLAADQLAHSEIPLRFLTVATLIYAIGAGITAAVGTRLALQLILVKRLKLHSFQLRDLLRPGTVISCQYLPMLGLGNFRACCLP